MKNNGEIEAMYGFFCSVQRTTDASFLRQLKSWTNVIKEVFVLVQIVRAVCERPARSAGIAVLEGRGSTCQAEFQAYMPST